VAVSNATQPALLFGAGVVGLGALLSLAIPKIGAPVRVDDLEALEEASV